MFRISAGRPVAALLLVVMLALVGCDVVDQQAGPVNPSPPVAGESQTERQQPAQQSPATAGSRATSSALSDENQFGRGGVVRAQEQPTAIPGEASALSEYEAIINNVYERDIGAVVSLTDGRASGSGFVIDEQGHIVTNNHVVEGMQQILISFADRSVSRGQLVGTFPEGDIAVVRAETLPQDLEPVTLGDSSNLRVGQITIAIGSPLRLQQTVTSGIISALNRSIEDLGETDPNSSLQGLIQTDASINPGNSGGPLFDSRGNVIGMNTLIATQNQGSVGLGFAVPVNRIKRVARQLIENGQYVRPALGVSIVPLDTELALELNLPSSGVMIASVTAGGPAEQAGLQGATEGVQLSNGEQFPTNGDIIVAINDQPVRTIGDLRNILETEADAGDTITVTFLRDGREQQTQLTLGALQ
jgi:S1-C subfamily serine protease